MYKAVSVTFQGCAAMPSLKNNLWMEYRYEIRSRLATKTCEYQSLVFTPSYNTVWASLVYMCCSTRRASTSIIGIGVGIKYVIYRSTV